MPKLQEDFSKISSSFEPLPENADGYRMRLEEIEDQAANEETVAALAAGEKQPALIFQSVVTEGECEDRAHWDYVYLKKKNGKPNRIGLGRVKAYAEAILGKERANAQEIDTDELLKGEFLGVIKQRGYADKTTGEQKLSSDLKKILPVG